MVRIAVGTLAFLGPLAAAATPPSAGAPEAERDAAVVLQVDNDLFANSDRDYTNGVRLGFIRPIRSDTFGPLQNALRRLSGAENALGPFGRATGFDQARDIEYDWGIALTQLMFTPDDPEAPAPPPGERPYAGWLGAEFSLHAKDREALSSVTLSLGVTGEPSLAESTQDFWHRNVSDSPIFQGWDTQVPRTVTVNLHFDRKRRYPALRRIGGGPVDVDGFFSWGAALGNFRTDAYVGSLLRGGVNLPPDYSTPRLQLGNYSHDLFRGATSEAAWSLYGFLGARLSAVAHDVTLRGPLVRDFDEAETLEPLVAEGLAGFGLRFRSWEISYAHTLRTDEFEGQDANQAFGSVMIRYRY